MGIVSAARHFFQQSRSPANGEYSGADRETKETISIWPGPRREAFHLRAEFQAVEGPALDRLKR
jgi:hypothetical protein